MRRVGVVLGSAAGLGGALAALAQPTPPPPARSAPTLGGIVLGSVARVDYGARRLTVTPVRKGDGEQTVELAADAALVRLDSATAGQVRVGDRLSVTGLPLVLDARQVRIGDERPGGTPARPVPPPPAAPSRRGPAPRPSNRPAPPPLPPPGSMAQFYGQVVRINPIVLSFQSGGPTFEVRTNRYTRFTRVVKITLAQVKAGDPVMVFGRRLPDGKLQARRVQVGLEGMPFTRGR